MSGSTLAWSDPAWSRSALACYNVVRVSIIASSSRFQSMTEVQDETDDKRHGNGTPGMGLVLKRPGTSDLQPTARKRVKR